jgi:hypothetical protein
MWTSLRQFAVITIAATKNQQMDIAIITLLENVSQHLEASAIAYRQYLQNGKTYYYAKQLMKYNSAIRLTLEENKSLLTGKLKQSADELILHYDEWMKKWLELEKELKPGDEDEFVFQNTHTFPKEAARYMEEVLAGLKKSE